MTCSLLFVTYLQNHYSPSWCQRTRPISHIPGSFTGLASFFFFPHSFLLCWVPTMWLLLRHQEHSSQQSRQKSTSSWRSHPDPNGGSLQICSERARYDGDKQSREGDWECSGHGGSFEQSGLERPLLGWSHFSRDLEKARKSGVCVSGGRVSLEERTVSVQALGRQESAWCVSRIAGQWCQGAMVGGWVRQAVPFCRAILWDYLGEPRSRIWRSPVGSILVLLIGRDR